MRYLSTFALAGLFGGLFLVGDASACHKKKACTCPAPVVAYVPAPVVACAPVKTKHMKMPKIKMAHHKKVAPVCTTYAPATYAAPQSYATGQASGQGM